MAQTLLKVDNINVFYGNIHAVKDVSFEVNEGEIVTLIGANGAGKSTTLKTVSGLLHPKTGDVLYKGKSIKGVRAHKIVEAGLAQVPEGRHVFLHMTVEENLDMGGYTQPASTIGPNKEKVFELFPRLKERRKQLAGTMSGGDAVNITAGEARMVAVLRSFSDAGRDTAIQEVRRICKGIGIAFDCDIEVNLEEGYALQYNDPAMIDLVNKAVTAAGGKAEFIDKPFSGSEDFSFFGKLTGTPSAFMMVDAGRGENAVSLHNGKIVFNEEVMKHGVTGLAAIAMEYLNR